MISRHWHGTALPARADEYLAHLQQTTFPKLKHINGFRGARVLTRRRPSGVEFLVITEWESESAIRAFAGDDTEAAVVPDVVQALMLSYDRRAQHYELRHEA